MKKEKTNQTSPPSEAKNNGETTQSENKSSPNQRLEVTATIHIFEPHKPKTIHIKIGDIDIEIPVTVDEYASFRRKFLRANPSLPQRETYWTLMNLMRESYVQGIKDANKLN
jgi:hypothetical protein